MRLYLLRHPEIGKEPRPEKSKARRDILEQLAQLAPDARATTAIGRLYVESDRDLRDELARLHGITSYSPCERCSLDELPGQIAALAGPWLAGGKRFAVRARRTGGGGLRTQELARVLGSRLLAAAPGAQVDLSTPEVEVGVEVRGDTAFVFRETLPGLDEKVLASRQAYAEPRFVVDHMLGTLATRLRLLGFDTLFCRDTADCLLLRASDEEQRILLTQDHNLARLGAGAGYLVQARELAAQVSEVLAHFGLQVDEASVLSRCSLCNEPLESVDRAAVEGRVPERVFALYEAFSRCPSCDKIYWKGSHHAQMRLDGVVEIGRSGSGNSG